jgi:hypothetical protein
MHRSLLYKRQGSSRTVPEFLTNDPVWRLVFFEDGLKHSSWAMGHGKAVTARLNYAWKSTGRSLSQSRWNGKQAGRAGEPPCLILFAFVVAIPIVFGCKNTDPAKVSRLFSVLKLV